MYHYYLANSAIHGEKNSMHFTKVSTETLSLYLSVTDKSVTSILVREDASTQNPIYFVIKVLQGLEIRYQKTEKVMLALVTSAQKLRAYF